MHHGTGEHEINRALNIVDAHRCWRNHAGRCDRVARPYERGAVSRLSSAAEHRQR
jgi:hypothetical protein